MIVFCRKAEKMTELEYICPLAHCVNLTWYAGGLLYFAGKESDRVTLSEEWQGEQEQRLRSEQR